MDEAGDGRAPSGDLLDEAEERDLEALRREVEAEYDFDEFGPADMARMSGDEWEAVFDPDSWVTGRELLDRVEEELKARIDRVVEDGRPLLVAWSDEGYAVVYPDGSIEGAGTVLRDVKATVALCSMAEYEPESGPEGYELPTPEEVESGTGEFGNLMLQVVAGAQVLCGLALGVAWLAGAVTTIVAPVAAGGFLLVGLFLFSVVANARLSDRFRAEEFRERLRAVEAAGEKRPEFLPGDDADGAEGAETTTPD
jgi:hypothetical protein